MNAIKVDQAISQQIFSIMAKASLENLSAGELLQGRVQSLENGLLFIKLLDGGTFTANVPEGFTASQGELITLEIGERTNNQLTAKIVPTGTQQATMTKTAEQNSLNQQISQKLAAYGALASDKLVAGVLDLLKAEPGMTMNQASFLVANQMESNPEMVQIMQKISQQEFQLHDNLQSLKEGLAQALTQADSSVRQEILTPLLISTELEELSQTLEQMLIKSDSREALIQNVRELLTKILLDETEGVGGKLNQLRSLDEKQLSELFKTALASLKGHGSPEEMNNLMKVIRKALEDMHTKADTLLKGEAKEVDTLLDKLFDRAIVKAEDGTLEDMALKEKAKALKEIVDFSQKALNQMDSKTQNANLSSFKEIDSAFRFFNQVTTYDALIHLPIKINQENTTGELYVMKRKKGKKKVDADNFTLFLSLQTSSLGRIESFLNSSQKCVTVSFRVERDDLVKLVKDSHRVLYDGLLKKGYKLAEMKCRVLEKDITDLCEAPLKAEEVLGLQASLDLKI